MSVILLLAIDIKDIQLIYQIVFYPPHLPPLPFIDNACMRHFNCYGVLVHQSLEKVSVRCSLDASDVRVDVLSGFILTK